MTDFISGLVDRALNRAPVLERRRPSRFEPAPAAGRLGFARDLATDREGEVMVSGPDPLAKAEDLQASPKSRASDRAARTINNAAESSPVRASAVTTNLNREISPVPAVPERREASDALPARKIETVVLREIQPRESSERSKADSQLTTKAPAPPIIIPSASEALTKVAPSIRRDAEPESKARRDAVGIHKKELLPASPRRAATPPVLVPPRPVQPLATAKAEVKRESEPAPPTIQITIGRIEVRATAPAVAPTRNAGRQAPMLSLEDYLKSRESRGGRTS